MKYLITLIALSQSILLANDLLFESPKSSKTIEGLDLSGYIRNDALFYSVDDSSEFSDILTNRLKLKSEQGVWHYYADASLYLYYGDIQEDYGDYRGELSRAYIRYYQKKSSMTLGKTFINQGIQSVFNPFYIDDSLDFSDVEAEREGMLACNGIVSVSTLSEFDFFGAYSNTHDAFVGGGEYLAYMNNVELGGVLNRYAKSGSQHELIEEKGAFTQGGIFIKGDAELGLNASYSITVYDDGSSVDNEFVGGIDYSFLESSLVSELAFYYNHTGEKEIDQVAYDETFPGIGYVYSSSYYIIDDFTRAGLRVFANVYDLSMMLMPYGSVIIADGLTATLLVSTPLGEKRDEYSKERLGDYTCLVRLEGVF